ncbi:MAG: thioredoxin [Armatimonadota bacterium]
MSKAQAVTAADFDTVVMKSQIPVVVDFWAEWCSPCRALAPTLDQLAIDFDGKIMVVKVNVDQEPDLAMNYNVQSIPTLLFVKNGELQDQAVGNLALNKLHDIVNKVLAS